MMKSIVKQVLGYENRKKIEPENQKIINELIERIPKELLSNKDLYFSMGENIISMRTRQDVGKVICFVHPTHAEFSSCRSEYDDYYCKIKEFIQHYPEGRPFMEICPYTTICDKVEAFVKDYNKKYSKAESTSEEK